MKNITPLSRTKERKYSLEEASKIVTCGFPCDLDTASMALSQARSVLDVLTVAARGTEIDGTYNGSLVQSIYAALSEVDRARAALFGSDEEVSHG